MVSVKLPLLSPLTGRTLPLTDVPDPVFAEGMMGDGIAIEPSAGEVRAPIAGTVAVLFPTGHAVALQSADGVEVLIHVGLESVATTGIFTPVVAVGDVVEAGDLLVKFDLKRLRRDAASPISPVVITGLPEGFALEPATAGQTVEAGRDALLIVAK
ncbi:MAG: PTS glucose transporter subunit IIA [Mycobacterium leprae]